MGNQEQQQPQQTPKPKSKKLLWFFLILIILIITAAIGWFLWQKFGNKEAAKEQGGGNGAHRDHLDIFSHEEKGKFHAGIFGVVTCGELLFGFGHIEWGAVDFRQAGDEENDRR